MEKNMPTGGEWKASGIDIICTEKVGRLGQSFLINVPSYDNNFKECEESKANAKLFAASKMMYEELKRIYLLTGNKGTLEVLNKVWR